MQDSLADQRQYTDNSKPVFSVVIPTYNQADLLREALASVMTQTFAQFEAIVVDNHSTDHTLEVVGSFHDPRLRLLQVHNRGVIGLSRNLGIRETHAPLVAFLDSDDTWYPEKLGKVYQAWQEHPDVGLVCHDEYAMKRGRVAYRLRYGPYQEDMERFLLLNGCRLSTSATVVRRTYLEEVQGFSEDPGLAGVEDYDLWVRLSPVCRFHFLHQFFGEFRLHSQSHSASTGVHLAHTLYLLEKHSRALEEQGRPLPIGLLRRRKAAQYARAVRFASSWWGKDGSLAHCYSALKESPGFWKTYARIARSLAVRLLEGASPLARLNGHPSKYRERTI